MFKAKVIVQGIAPLLQNRFPDEEYPENAKKIKTKVYKDDDEAKKRLYLDGKVVYQPAEHFVASMIGAAVNFKFEGKKTYKDAIDGGIFISPEKIPHKFQKWIIDRRPVVIQRSRIMRVRPKFEKWELEFDIECIDDRVTQEVVKEILEYAGLYKGIGDMRPRYGRFKVIKFDVYGGKKSKGTR
jgi:hypothetical protein